MFLMNCILQKVTFFRTEMWAGICQKFSYQTEILNDQWDSIDLSVYGDMVRANNDTHIDY